jgi:hypothetical protein
VIEGGIHIRLALPGAAVRNDRAEQVIGKVYP